MRSPWAVWSVRLPDPARRPAPNLAYLHVHPCRTRGANHSFSISSGRGHLGERAQPAPTRIDLLVRGHLTLAEVTSRRGRDREAERLVREAEEVVGPYHLAPSTRALLDAAALARAPAARR